jgi:DNA-binding transcriptional LysR family regulator
MAVLERVIGAQLIAREHGRQAFGLTDAGEILLRHLVEVEAQLGAAKADIDALVQGAVETLRVGAYESVGARLLPELVSRFHERFPGTRVEVEEALSDLDHLRGLEQGTLDVAFTLLPVPAGPFRTQPVLRDPWVLVVHIGSNLVDAPLDTLSLDRIGRLPLVCFRAPRSIEDVLGFFEDAGIEPNIVLQSDYNDAVQEFAAAGRGVALMPRLAVNPRDGRTRIVDLGDLIPPREIALAWHSERDRSETLATFVALGVELGSRLERSVDASVVEPVSLIDRAAARGPAGGERSDPLRASAVGDHGEPLPRAGSAGAAGGA